MNEEKYLEKFKEVYLNKRATPRLSMDGWSEISAKIDGMPSQFLFWRKSWAVALLSILLIAGGSFVFYTNVSAALPGDRLYPVKILSEDIILKVTGNNQIKINNRAGEIIDLSDEKSEDTKALQTVSKEYSEEVKKIKSDPEVSKEKKEDLQKHLEEDNKKFTETVQRNPEVEQDIKSAIESSREELHRGGD